MAMDQQQEGVDELLCEIDHWKGRVIEAEALLEDVRASCLFADDDGFIGITTDPHIDERLFDKICGFLAKESP